MAYSESDTRSKLNLTTRAIEKQLANLKKENRLQRVGSPKKWE